MLEDFIRTNRDEIIRRTTAERAERAATTTARNVSPSAGGVAVFVDQLVARLHTEEPSTDDLAVSAASHGTEMLRHGCTIAQVVAGYGDVCQVVTSLAIERNASITTDEFRTLNRCLDTATAEAVSEYEHQRDRLISNNETERLGVLAHELRNKLNSAMMSFDLLRQGTVGIGGSTGAVLGRSLIGLRDVIHRALTEVRLESGALDRERMSVWTFIEELEVVARFEANEKAVEFHVDCADDNAEVEVDRHILASAVGNLLQNAFKFTSHGGRVTLRVSVTANRVFIDVEDECGGLPSGGSEVLFRPFEQRGTDRTGLGLGLAISRRGVEAHGGKIHVRDRPGKGCVFTIDLPRAVPKSPGAHESPCTSGY